MAQPTPYTRHYNFTDWQAVNPTKPLPATQLESELNAVKVTLDGTLENLAKIQRDDGLLANQMVTPESLSAGTLAMIGTGEFLPRGAWAAATVYAVNDLVEYNQATYLCLVAHTAAMAFPTDLSAHKWLMIANGALTGSAAAVDLFVGNGSQTVFTLSVSYANSNAAQVFVNGVCQIPTQDFTISGNTLTMVTAPPAPTVGGRKTLMVRGVAVEAQLAVSAAQLSEANASGYASAANASKVAAAVSEAAAAASFTNFDKRYLGAKAADPTLDNQGAALTAGALYFSTSLNAMKIYSGSAWSIAYVPLAGLLFSANNLSDVASPAAALANLLPSQSGKAGQLLGTNGSSASWVAPTFAFKNRIINGGMRIDQRNVGAALTPTATSYTLDRWQLGITAASKLTVQQVTDAPSGAKNSLKVSVASQFSPGAADIFQMVQAIEGNNIVDLQFGSSGALTITTSFQVKASVAGTYSCAISNGAGTRSYVAAYTISSANVWTPLVITIAGDTTGTWATDNTAGLYLIFDLGSGSNFNATAGAWNSGNYKRTSGSVTFVNQVNGSTWQLAQVQLEAGSVATAFDVRSIQQELVLCQRYYEKNYAQSTKPGTSAAGQQMTLLVNTSGANSYVIPNTIFKTIKRATPTINYWDAAGNAGMTTTISCGGLSQADNQNNISTTYVNDTSFAPVVLSQAAQNQGFNWTASAEL